MIVLITDVKTFYRNFRLFMKAIGLTLRNTGTESVTIISIKLGSVQVEGSGDPVSDSGSS